MTAAPAGYPSPDPGYALTLALLLLAPLVIAGIALVNTGLGRSRSAAQSLLGCLTLIAVSAIAFAVVGISFASGPSHSIWIAGKPWNWLGSGALLMRHFRSTPMASQLAVVFEFIAAAMCVMLPWGSGADRWRLPAGSAGAALLAGGIFPVLVHWVWNGGWLAQLGANFGLGAGFLDMGGAACVHALGGLSALAAVWIAGARKGKFPREGLATAMPAHNAVYVLFGCLLATVGWLAWNSAGALIWLHGDLTALPVTAINTLLSAAAALVATFTVTRTRFSKPDASMCANGWLAGLVCSSACAALISPLEAMLTGAVAGIVTPLLVELLELALSIDDPSGAISVHGFGGLWGLLAAGIFAPQPGQMLAQLVGLATLLGFLFPLVYLLFALANRILPFRVDADGERLGMDLHELGGGAYPEFVLHRDDSYR